MTKHRTDLIALMFGLTFAISGAIVLVTQATSVDISPEWGAAVGLIVLGAVALVATVARAGVESIGGIRTPGTVPSVSDPDTSVSDAIPGVSAEDRAD